MERHAADQIQEKTTTALAVAALRSRMKMETSTVLGAIGEAGRNVLLAASRAEIAATERRIAAASAIIQSNIFLFSSLISTVFRPHGRGRPCEGESLEVTICRIGHPCPAELDNRAGECRATSHDLLPAESPSTDQCKLFCRDDNHRQRPTNQFVSHGTRCSYDDPHRFCIFGKCENYGCDIGGTMKYYNECGICDGRTSDCTYVDQSVRKTNRQAGGEIFIKVK